MTTMYPDSFWQIVQNGPKSGDSTIDPTPSLYDQILAAAGTANAAALAANQAKDQLLQDKANGVFNGADGASAKVSVGSTQTGPEGSEAQVYSTGTDQDLELHFVIPRGRNGVQGETGPQGPIGATGPKGDTGGRGPQGPKGDPFTYSDFTQEQLASLKGDKGEKGDTGPSGADGKSAYQYAVDGGYTGTEDEFKEKLASEIPVVDNTLTHSGQAADAAKVGEELRSLSGKIDNIPSGKDGADGQDGITPTIGENGNWYLGDTDTGKPSRGEPGQDGADGKDGAPGAAGADGYTPVKGTDYFTEAEKQEIAEAAAGMVSIPEKLPNPNALTFTGAIEGTYDGSAPITVDIPNGGGSGGSSGWTGEITELFKLDIEADSNLSLVNLGFPLSDFWNYKEIRIQVRPTTNTSIGWVYLATYDDSKNKTIDIFRTLGASHIWKLRPLGNKVIDSNITVGNPSVYYFGKGLESYQNHNVDSIQAYIITELQKSQNVCIYPLNAFTIALNITVWGVK